MLLKENGLIKRKYVSIFLTSLFCYVISVSCEIFDSFAAGKYVSEEAVAGIELGTPILSILYAFNMFFCYGIGVLYNRELGKHDKEKSQKIAGMGIIVSLLLGLVSFAVIYFGADWFVSLFNASDEVTKYAASYVRKLAFGAPFQFAFWTLYHLVTYDGDNITTMFADITTASANIFLPTVLAKQFGFEGLGFIFLCAHAAGFLVLLIHFLNKKNSISFKPYFSLKDLFTLVKTSSSYALTYVYIAAIDIIFNAIIVNRFTDMVLPAYTVVNFLINMAEVLTTGIYAGQMFISVNWGEKNNNAIKRILKIVAKFEVILSLAMTVFFVVIAPTWPDFFAISDPSVKDMAVFAGYVIPITFIFCAVIFTSISYYPLINKVIYSNVTGFLYMLVAPCVLCIPLAYLFDFKAMTLGFALTPVFTVLVMFLYFKMAKKSDAPLFLKQTDVKEFHYDLLLNKENISELKNIFNDELKKEKLNISCEIASVMEDKLFEILANNTKKVIAEVTVLIEEDGTRLIIQDNGKTFNNTSLSKEGTYTKESDLAVSFNRNTFSWGK